MKYIKKISNWLKEEKPNLPSEKLYQKFDENSYIEFIDSHRKEEFTEKDIINISQFFNKYIGKFKVELSDTRISIVITLLSVFSIRIYKYNDDWYVSDYFIGSDSYIDKCDTIQDEKDKYGYIDKKVYIYI